MFPKRIYFDSLESCFKEIIKNQMSIEDIDMLMEHIRANKGPCVFGPSEKFGKFLANAETLEMVTVYFEK
jgi:hypothetical protein